MIFQQSIQLLIILHKNYWFEVMLMNFKNIIFFPVVAILVLLGLIIGMFGSRLYEKYWVYEVYKKEITLAENITLDNEDYIMQNGEPLVLLSGTQGKMWDKIDYWGDSLGYDYIDASFVLENGSTIYIPVSINPVEDEIRKPSIGINKIASFQTILSEYAQSRERYHSRVKISYIVGIIVGAAASLTLALILSFKYIKTIKGNNSVSVFFGIVIFIDLALILVIAFCMFLLKAK